MSGRNRPGSRGEKAPVAMLSTTRLSTGLACTQAAGLVALRPQGKDLIGVEAEEEEVVRADQIADLDIGPIQRADGEGAVEGEFHIARPRGLLAGQGICSESSAPG